MGKRGSKQRLTAPQKQYIVDLIVQGETESEIATVSTNKFKKQVTIRQVRYYSRSRREEIVDKRQDDISAALEISIANLPYRINKLQKILDLQLSKVSPNLRAIRRTLLLADMMMDRAYRRLTRSKRAEEEEHEGKVLDFLEIKKQLTVTKKSMKEIKRMEKRLGGMYEVDERSR